VNQISIVFLIFDHSKTLTKTVAYGSQSTTIHGYDKSQKFGENEFHQAVQEVAESLIPFSGESQV